MRQIQQGSLNNSVEVRIIDATDGTPEQAVEHNTSGAVFWYRRPGGDKTAISLAALDDLEAAHTDGGIEHIDDGLYRLDAPDAAFAAGVDHVVIGGAVDDMIVIPSIVQLVNYSPVDGAPHKETGHAVVPPVLDRPASSSKTYRFQLYLYTAEGNMLTPDTAPTCAVENDQGTDRSGNLGTVTADGTGHYYVDYTVASTHALEALTVEWSVVSDDDGYGNRLYAAACHVVDPLESTDITGAAAGGRVLVADDTLYVQHTAGETVKFVITNPAGEVFDFDDDTFKSAGSATTPWIQGTERTAGGGTSSIYTATLTLANINAGPTQMKLVVSALEQQGGSLNLSTDPAIADAAPLLVQFGRSGGWPVEVKHGVSYDTTGGGGVAHTAWLEIDGEFVDMNAADDTATCTIAVREFGSGSDQYTLPASGDLNPNASGWFEDSNTTPNFTGDKTYLATVTITTGGETYTALHKFLAAK